MSSLRKLFEALQQVERLAHTRGQKMHFTACSCCGKATALIAGSKKNRDVVISMQVQPSGAVEYSFPNEQNDDVVQALKQELVLAQLQ